MRRVLLLIVAAGALVHTEEPVPDPARAAFIAALAKAPAVVALHERVAAARHAQAASDRLPDPMLGAGYARRTTAMERWPVYEVSVEQPLPRWGERDARVSRSAAETALSLAELQESVGDAAAEIATMLAEAEASRARLALSEAQIQRSEALRTVIAARSASGAAASAEQLAVDSRLAALAVERDTMRRMAEDAEQEVRARLGLAPDADLPPFAAPQPAGVAIARTPGQATAAARTAEADAMFDEARASRYPETAVGVRYEREIVPEEPMTTIGLELRISLPVWQASSEAQEASALARRRAAHRDGQAAAGRARAALGRAERAATVAASARAAAARTRDRLDAEYATLVRSAAVQGGVTMITVLDVLDRLGEAQRQVIEAEAAARQAAAGLWRLAVPDV